MNLKLSEAIIGAATLALAMGAAVSWQAYADARDNSVRNVRVVKSAPDCPLVLELSTSHGDLITLTAKPGRCLTQPERYRGHVYEHGRLSLEGNMPHHVAGYTQSVTRGTNL